MKKSIIVVSTEEFRKIRDDLGYKCQIHELKSKYVTVLAISNGSQIVFENDVYVSDYDAARLLNDFLNNSNE